jgi:hypothetical protein
MNTNALLLAILWVIVSLLAYFCYASCEEIWTPAKMLYH